MLAPRVSTVPDCTVLGALGWEEYTHPLPNRWSSLTVGDKRYRSRNIHLFNFGTSWEIQFGNAPFHFFWGEGGGVEGAFSDPQNNRSDKNGGETLPTEAKYTVAELNVAERGGKNKQTYR